MVKIDIMALANDFILEADATLMVRLEIARALVTAAVEYINESSGKKRNKIAEDIEDFADTYGMSVPDKVFSSYVVMINRMIRSSGWDPRLVVKVDYSTIGVVYTTAVLVMDLEATAERLGWNIAPPVREEEDIMDVVTDTPSMDDINEFNKSDGARAQSIPPLSSNRRAEFVRKDQRRNIQNHRG